MHFLLLLLAAILTTATVIAIDVRGEQRGLQPPGFSSPGRRWLANLLLAFVLFSTFFSLLGPKDPNPDLASMGPFAIFGFQIILLATLAAWYALGYWRVSPKEPAAIPAELARQDSGLDLSYTPIETSSDQPSSSEHSSNSEIPSGVNREEPDRKAAISTEFNQTSEQPGTVKTTWEDVANPRREPHDRHTVLHRLGLYSPQIEREVSIGLLAGFGAWLMVLVTTAVLAGLLQSAGLGEPLGLNRDPSPLIAWLAAQPILIRCLISLAAGVSEELFFRGFLQPRLGVGISTALFVAGHAGYGQPMMLVGITLLSLFYAKLFSWRRNVWAAMVAHTLFDAIQLLVVIPAALQALESGSFSG